MIQDSTSVTPDVLFFCHSEETHPNGSPDHPRRTAAAFSRDKEKPQGILSDSRGFFCRIVGKMQAGRALKSGSSAEISK